MSWSQKLLLTHPKVSHVVTVALDIDYAQKIGLKSEFMTYVKGGQIRQESIRNGFLAMPECDIVLVHDGARPFASIKIVDQLIERASEAACLIPVISNTSALKSVESGVVTGHQNGKYMLAQTPQLVWYQPLKLAFEKFSDRLDQFPDESSMIAELGLHVVTVAGSPANIKITHPDDETVARALASVLLQAGSTSKRC